MPTFDIATVNEDPNETIDLDDSLASLCSKRPDTSWCTAKVESPVPVALEENQAVVFYAREDGEYTDWGLHLWNNDNCDSLTDETLGGVEWPTPFLPTGFDEELGAYFVLNLKAQTCVNFIIHKGDEKALGDADLNIDLTQGNALATNHGSSQVTYLGGEDQPAFDPNMTLEALMATFEPGSEQAQELNVKRF